MGLGIDIGQANTKVVWAESRRGQSIKLCEATISTRVPQSNAEGVSHQWSTQELKLLAKRLSHLFGRRSDLRRSHIAVTMSMAVCDYRTVYLPKNGRANTQGLQQVIATATSDSRPRCLAILPHEDQQPADQPSKLRCFSLPEDISWSVAKALDGIGFAPHTMNGLPWCLANALRLTPPTEDPTAIRLAIDWSFGEPTLVSVKDGSIDYVRCLSRGALRELASQAITDYQMSEAEAVRWIGLCLQSSAEATGDSPIAHTQDWVRECCVKFAHEIDTAVDFIRWRHQDRKLDSLWLMGGATRIAGLTELLQSQLTCKVQNWTWRSGKRQLTADYATATSLALQGVQHA